MAEGCGFTACKYMIVRTIRLKKGFVLCVVDMYIYVFIVMVTFINSFTHVIYLSVNKI